LTWALRGGSRCGCYEFADDHVRCMKLVYYSTITREIKPVKQKTKTFIIAERI
jgi:hypothetical protein